MNELRELELSEMKEISGGSQLAYDLGYALGCAVKQVLFVASFAKFFV